MQWLTDLSDSLLLCDLLGTQPCLQANAIYLELERMGESFEQLLLHTHLCLSADWFASVRADSSQASRHG